MADLMMYKAAMLYARHSKQNKVNEIPVGTKLLCLGCHGLLAGDAMPQNYLFL